MVTKALQVSPDMLDEAGTVFDAPWQAQVFAMAVHFSESGLFTWKEWADCFSAEIAKQEAIGYDPKRDYYHCWSRALEKILCDKGLIDDGALSSELNDTLENWPHPDHVAAREPIAKDPAGQRPEN